jgi:hypothetical protein
MTICVCYGDEKFNGNERSGDKKTEGGGEWTHEISLVAMGFKSIGKGVASLSSCRGGFTIERRHAWPPG